MKTIYDSNPEFSLTYTHEGVSVTLSGKVLLQDYLLTAGSDQDCEELVGKIFENALPDAAHQAANELKKFHYEFHKALSIGLTPDLVRSFSSPKYSPCQQCNAIIVAKSEGNKEQS